MNPYFGSQYSQEDLQNRNLQRRQNERQRQMSIAMAQQQQAQQQQQQQQNGGNNMNMTDLLGGESLNDIIIQNNKEIQRRQSFPSPFSEQQGMEQSVSMLYFGAANHELNNFQFAPTTGAVISPAGQQSLGSMDMGSYGDMGQGITMPASQMGFNPSLQAPEALRIDTSGYQVMSPEMNHGLISYSPLGMEEISASSSNINLFSPNDFAQNLNPGMEDLNNQYMISGMPSQQNELDAHDDGGTDSAIPDLGAMDEMLVNSPLAMNLNHNSMNYESPSLNSVSQPSHVTRESSYNIAASNTTATSPVQDVESKPEPSPFSNIYSQSGFDMLGALVKVASRKNPEINIGKVDLSCAFVVCNVTLHDSPIVYVSEIFERLTGYTKHEVLGRNCRFLQSPDGKVQSGVRREFVDNDSVHYLKEKLDARKEAQISLINYRKGAQPFMNLLTMIPITGEDDIEIKYYVGFQVDLVEKPTSVEAKGVNGMYVVDYSQGALPKYEWKPPEGLRGEATHAVSRDEVGTVLNAMKTSPGSDAIRGHWDKILLENTDDVIHVISLKGLFLYLSPSCRRVLEYDESELTGTALSSVCHPSDIVPVTRELKDTAPGSPISIVFRIRRKKSGYTWFESHGAVHVEQGKGRKFIISVGRERPVYVLGRGDLEAAGGIGDSEIWCKLSTSGMFLFISANVRHLLDRQPEELVGTSMQQLMRSESKTEFGRVLEKARIGKTVSYKHEVLNKRGLNLQAQTTLHPGDASEGSKPTFLVAQTRLIKQSSRSSAPSVVSQNSVKPMISLGKNDRLELNTTLNGLSGDPSMGFSQRNADGDISMRSPVSFRDVPTEAGSAGLPIGSQDRALASADNIFDELKATRCTSWQFELRQMEKSNRMLADELASLLSNKKKRKRRKGGGKSQQDCANCHTRVTPEWRRGPSGERDLCNSCGLRWAKSTNRVSLHTSQQGSKMPQKASSPLHTTTETSSKPKSSLTGSSSTLDSLYSTIPPSSAEVGVLAKLGDRMTMESMPMHEPSVRFMEGGERGITNIESMDDGGDT
ncbi:hypothetical protein BJ878DRAFT_504074 [Calycina marina]|uniref:LOV domain-containing protein n=1 Tax=Calycina marina TaxID=1763456 RepID=A0A9P7Z3Z7_9HELO|nr:hypothetical protein BJ878DRAFT_504074 [Calycina marina]